MITFGPIEGSSEEEVRSKLNSLYTPNGYKITKWKENTGFWFQLCMYGVTMRLFA